jgi:L-lactate dehydrogenase
VIAVGLRAISTIYVTLRFFPAILAFPSVTFSDCCSADVTIITTGVSQAGLKSRLDGLQETADIVHALVRDVAEHNPRGILLIASNPVDVLTYAAWKWSGLPATRVMGSGTGLDTARFRRRLAERYKISSDNVRAYIIGEHGDPCLVFGADRWCFS